MTSSFFNVALQPNTLPPFSPQPPGTSPSRPLQSAPYNYHQGNHRPSVSGTSPRLPPMYPQPPAQQPVSHPSPVDSDGETDSKKRKRNRIALSCTECKRRKVKCDRKIPCESCVRRGEAASCRWEDQTRDVAVQPFALGTELDEVKSHLGALQEIILTLHPEMANKLEALQMGETPPPMRVSYPSVSGQSGKSRDPNEESVTMDSDTEDAANILEDLALGKFTSHHGRVAVDISVHRGPTNEFEDLIKPALAQGKTSVWRTRPLPANTLFTNYSAQFDQAIALVPPRVCADAWLEFNMASGPQRMFSENSYWIWHSERHLLVCYTKLTSLIALYPPTLRDEMNQFWALYNSNNGRSVDPAWLAMVFMCLALSLRVQNPTVAVKGDFSEDQLENLPNVYYGAAQTLLQIAEMTSRPQFRCLMTCLLMCQFLMKLSSMKPEKDVQFLMWHSAGTRIAHLLGYHKLGANPETMPDEDPGLPHGSNSMKRQAVLTAWNEIYFIDSMGGAQRGYFTIDDREFDTVPPYNVNDTDLGLHIHVNPKPSSELTDYTVGIAIECLARHTKKVALLSRDPKNLTHEKIMEIDRSMRSQLGTLIRTDFQGFPPMVAVLASGIHNKILRLHRPWMIRGYKDPRCAESTRAALDSAKAIVNAIGTYGTGSIKQHWYSVYHAIGATITIHIHMLHLLDEEGDHHAEIDKLRKEADKLVDFFKAGNQVAGEDVRMKWSHGLRVAEALRQAERERSRDVVLRGRRRGLTDHETIGDILKRVSGTFSNGPSDASDSPLQPPTGTASPSAVTGGPQVPPIHNSGKTSLAPLNSSNAYDSDWAAAQLMQWMGLNQTPETPGFNDLMWTMSQDPLTAAIGFDSDRALDYALGSQSELFSL